MNQLLEILQSFSEKTVLILVLFKAIRQIKASDFSCNIWILEEADSGEEKQACRETSDL